MSVVYTDEGVVYTLRFGEVVFASGDELTAGTPDEAEKKAMPRPRRTRPRKPRAPRRTAS